MARAVPLPAVWSRLRSHSDGVRPESPFAPAYWERADADPELAKALGHIQSYVAEAAALLELPDVRAPLRTAESRSRLRELLSRDVDGLRIDSAWELANALKRELLLLGDSHYVWAKLEYEAARNGKADRWHQWTDHFSEERLSELLEQRNKGNGALDAEVQADAVRHLRHLYMERAEAGLERRVRAKQKCLYLSRLALVLVGLFVALAAALEWIGGPGIWGSVVLAASAGALGATLAGVFRVRDELTELDDLRSFWPAMRVQPLVGAVSGLVILLVLESGAMALGDGETEMPAARALLAFAAGFSEPFFLGVVGKVAAIPDKGSAGARKR